MVNIYSYSVSFRTITFLFCALKISSKSAREEERRIKYKKIIDNKIERYGFCNTIIIRKIADKDAAILLQNAFPTLEKYIDHIHTVDGVPLNVPTDLQNEIKNLFKNMIGLKKRGTNLFFTDIDSLKKKMIDEIE